MIGRPLQQPAGGGELVLRQELVRLVGDLDRAGAEDGAVQSRAAGASRRRWRRRRWPPRVWPTRSQRWRWMGEASSSSIGGLSESSSISGSNGAAAARAARLTRSISSSDGIARQRPESHLDDAAVGHHVDRRAAVDRADVERHEGDLREEVAVGQRPPPPARGGGRRAPRSPGRRARWRWHPGGDSRCGRRCRGGSPGAWRAPCGCGPRGARWARR